MCGPLAREKESGSACVEASALLLPKTGVVLLDDNLGVGEENHVRPAEEKVCGLVVDVERVGVIGVARRVIEPLHLDVADDDAGHGLLGAKRVEALQDATPGVERLDVALAVSAANLLDVLHAVLAADIFPDDRLQRGCGVQDDRAVLVRLFVERSDLFHDFVVGRRSGEAWHVERVGAFLPSYRKHDGFIDAGLCDSSTVESRTARECGLSDLLHPE